MYAMWSQQKSFREIGEILGRSHTSISREVKRNRNQETGEYLPCKAQSKADKRERLQRQKAPLKEPVIFLYVRRKLRMGWSPETIAGRLPIDHPHKKICVETIYQYIYSPLKHPKEQLFQHLVLHRTKRMKKHGRKVQKFKIPGRIGIELRPDDIQKREEYGHGETDLMEGIRTDKPVVNVTVERTTRYTQLKLLPNKTAKEKTQAVNEDHENVPLLSMTTDNGIENTHHQQWSMTTYFANPYHSWEKGTVENTINRLRRYLPKKQSIATVTSEDLRYIAWEMNNTPRKCLNFLTPAEALARALQNPIF
jgi:IS30 family transposase